MYLVENRSLLELREHVDAPVIHLEHHGESFSVGPASNSPDRLDSAGGTWDPMAATTHHSYESDYESVRDILQQTFARIDLLEPFHRIATAISTLTERDERFK